MGGKYGSVQVRTSDLGQVVEAARAIAEKTSTKFLIGPPLAGWIGIYPSGSGLDPGISASLASAISDDILHLVSYKEDVFSYSYYRRNSLVDEYCSCPDYFAEVSSSERARVRGRPEVFAGLLQEPAKVAELQNILAVRDDPPTADDTAAVAKFSKQVMKLAQTDPERPKSLVRNPRKLAAQLNVPLPRQLEMLMNAVDESMQSESEVETDAADGDVPPNIKVFPVLEQMFRFARLFGIKNAISSYEYLRAGEIDNIEGWSDFVSIPDQSAEQTLKDIAAATLRSRIESLKAAGLLLNIDSRPGKQNR
ncbi:MAG: hypothetical protein ACREDR_01700 [Blastocatellia bacterium]